MASSAKPLERSSARGKWKLGLFDFFIVDLHKA
jgi:hypothetical protein